jgi:Polyketide cyclase / dehydrase and lipid transport
MTGFTVTKHVATPVEVVFDVASDLAHAAEHVLGIEKIELLTPGPVGVGTKWRETRRMMGREATETLEIKAFDRPRSYTVGCESCGCYFETVFRFEPQAGGTDVTLDVRTKSLTFMAKLMSPIGKLMMGKVMRKCMDDDLEDVKRVAESRAGAPGNK